MKTINRYKVAHLRIYPVEREVISSVSGTKGTRAGALVFAETLPASNGQTATNVLQLSGKQIDNLASMHGIRVTGRKGWMQLAGLMQVGRSAAQVSSEEHKKGDSYVDGQGEEKKYTMTTTNNQVDSIILSDRVADKLVNATIEAIVGSWDNEADFDDVAPIHENALPE